MGKFDDVISELEYQIKSHLAADLLGYDPLDQELNKKLLKQWQEAIEVLKANG